MLNRTRLILSSHQTGLPQGRSCCWQLARQALLYHEAGQLPGRLIASSHYLYFLLLVPINTTGLYWTFNISITVRCCASHRAALQAGLQFSVSGRGRSTGAWFQSLRDSFAGMGLDGAFPCQVSYLVRYLRSLPTTPSRWKVAKVA